MQYVYVAGAGTDAAIDLAITKQTRLALYSLIGGFRSKDFGLHTTEAVACDIAKFNGKFIQPVDGNTFADSGGYSFIVGEKSPQDLPVMIDCYTVYLESEGDIFDYIFSLDIPFSLKYKEFNTRKNIFEANEKSLTESQEVLVNCKELQDKFFFVWHFKMKEQFKVWKSLYSSLGIDKVIRNHAVGGMVGLKKAAKISFCPFTGMSFYILNCHLQGPFAGDDFRMHYLGVYSRSDRFHIAFLEKLFNGYLSGVSTVQMSYDSINPIHTVRMNAAVPLYSFNGKQFDVFPSLLDVPEEVLHNIAVDDAHAQMVLSEIERRRAGLRLENSTSFGPLNVYSNLQLDKFFSMVIDQYDLTGVIGKSSSPTSLQGCLTRIFDDIDKRYPKAFSPHMKDVIKLNLERTWSWHKWFTGKHDEATLHAKMSIEIDEIGFPADLQQLTGTAGERNTITARGRFASPCNNCKIEENMTAIYEVERTVGIKKSPEFQKKQLATHGLNVGLMCGHGCKYCSTPAVLRHNKIFKSIGLTSFQALQAGVAIVDPSTPARAAKDAAKLKPTDVVMLSTMTDAYAPESHAHNLGRDCAKAVLENSQAQLRILTKNAAVVNDFDLFAAHRDRVMLGLSVTAPVAKEAMMAGLEPNASKVSERLAAYQQAKGLGLRTFGMLCPLLPGIASSYDDIRETMGTILEFEPESIWVEPLNAWGDGLIQCRDALAVGGWKEESYRVDEIRTAEMHQLYTDDLIDTATTVAMDLGCLQKLKILVYADGKGYCCNQEAVIWLKG